jgi:hypothetical protein
MGMQSGSKHKQRGATFLGMLTIVAILGLAVYAAIRLVPIYKEYLDVTKALTQTASSLGGGATVADIRKSLERRWEVDDIKSLDAKDIQITPVGSGFAMHAEYRAESKFMGNVSLVVDFDKTVTTSGGPLL